jgi:glycosyltransferase involved in cell wall biosynthesis
MARGKPVIATRAGGVDTVVEEGSTGLLVRPSDSDELASRMLELLSDPAKARTMGLRGRDIVSAQFRVDTMVNLTAQLYHRILEAERVHQPAPAASNT